MPKKQTRVQPTDRRTGTGTYRFAYYATNKGSFKRNHVHVTSSKHLNAINQRRWVNRPPHKSIFFNSLREHCIQISGPIWKNYLSFLIYRKNAFEWDHVHFSSLSRLGAISQKSWFLQPHWAVGNRHWHTLT